MFTKEDLAALENVISFYIKLIDMTDERGYVSVDIKVNTANKETIIEQSKELRRKVIRAGSDK